uniref:Uncharacterized protein n=1 Tax=Chromera velia CCMP2878 TaxID=1169474 RepID=A0A0G4HKK6_9ALVE|eukprot:Cvel_28466.t1-p1 / transcript=Cvel_28466.t1 / gene=Cvel_28466 / organism=Chromera_velia_CCMP2878 / gene_product=hypothetical protein / transcript_product=hypothetical protein / location=Cvel_scaffold3731:12868-14007(+) / protein_length=169 / sequence_SO=supercontig / SO=protein_coding / is_pseudo=false
MSSGLSEGLRSVIKKATEEIETSESCEEWEEKLSNAGILSIEVFLHYLRIAGHIPFGMDRKFLNTILDFAQQRGEASDDDRIHIMTLEFPEGEAAKAAKLVRKKRQSVRCLLSIRVFGEFLEGLFFGRAGRQAGSEWKKGEKQRMKEEHHLPSHIIPVPPFSSLLFSSD